MNSDQQQILQKFASMERHISKLHQQMNTLLKGAKLDLKSVEEKEKKTRAIIPFYALRAFVDVEYGVVLSYGFYQVIGILVALKDSLKVAYRRPPEIISQDQFTVFLSDAFKDNISAFFLFFAVFIILIDDYYRSRILSRLAPCRTVRRFAMDISIGFLFGLAFFLINVKSSSLFFALGLVFLAGSRWANLVQKESDEWEQFPYTQDPRIKSHIRNWPLFRARMHFVWNQHLFIGLIFITIGFAIIICDPQKDYWLFCSLVVGFLYAIIEALRFVVEYRYFLKYGTGEQGSDERQQMLHTVFWIPHVIQNIFRKLA